MSSSYGEADHAAILLSEEFWRHHVTIIIDLSSSGTKEQCPARRVPESRKETRVLLAASSQQTGRLYVLLSLLALAEITERTGATEQYD